VFSLQNLGVVTDVRGYGMLAGFDIAPEGAPGRRGNLLQKRLFDAGLHIKTTGDAGLLAPAFIVEKDQIDEMVEILKQELIRL
jgi:beta-alanine--pyruvate transaminase